MTGTGIALQKLKSLTIRFGWRLRRSSRILFLGTAGMLGVAGAALQLVENSFVNGVGQNLFADAVLLVVAALILDRLSRARDRNDVARPFQVVYGELRVIYVEAGSLWLKWLVMACGARVEEMEELHLYAFDQSNEAKIKSLWAERSPQEILPGTLEILAAEARDIQEAIDRSYARIAPFGDLHALALLYSLRHSGFLAHTVDAHRAQASIGAVGLANLGKELLYPKSDWAKQMRLAQSEASRGVTPNRLEWENAADIMRALRAHLEEVGHLVAPYTSVAPLDDQVTYGRLAVAIMNLEVSPEGDMEAWADRAMKAEAVLSRSV